MASPIRVVLLNLEGPLAELSIDGRCTILDLKRKVEEICGFPPSCQALTVGRRIPRNSEQLETLREDSDATLSVTVINTVYRCLKEDGPWEDRLAAVNFLAAFAAENDEGAIAALTGCLTDLHADVQQAAALALARVMSPAAPGLSRLLSHADAGVRCAAVIALGSLGESAEPFAMEMAQLLTDEDKHVRNGVVRAFGELGKHGASATETFAQLMASPRGEIREAAAVLVDGLGGLAASAAPTLANHLASDDWQVRQASQKTLRKLGEAASSAGPCLVKLLQHSDPGVRHKALDALSDLGEHALPLVQHVVKLFADSASEVRAAAVRTLKKLSPKEGRAFLLAVFLELLSDSSDLVRHEAEEAICKFSHAEVAQQYRRAAKSMHHADSQVRAQAVKELGGLVNNPGSPPQLFAPEISALLGDKSPGVRLEAIKMVAGCGQSAVHFASQIAKLLKDANVEVRHEAVETLGSFGQQAIPFAADIAKLLADGHWQVSLVALGALGQLGDRAVPFKAQIIGLRTHPEAQLREKAAEVLNGLKACPRVSTQSPIGEKAVQEGDIRSRARAAVTRAVPKAAPAKVRPLVPINEAERMLRSVTTARSTVPDKMKQLQEIAKLAIAPARLTAVVARCEAGHACAWVDCIPPEYRAEECFAVDCDVCGVEDLQERASKTPFCHCRICSFDFCASCAVTRAGQDLARALREEREQRQREAA